MNDGVHMDCDNFSSNDKRVHESVLDNLIMLTREEVAQLLKATPERVSEWSGLGIINGIKTGRNIMFPQSEVKRFQVDYLGYDLSTYDKSKKSYESVIFEKNSR